MEEEGLIETSEASMGKGGTSSRESMPELMNSSLGTTVTREDSMMVGLTQLAARGSDTELNPGEVGTCTY